MKNNPSIGLKQGYLNDQLSGIRGSSDMALFSNRNVFDENSNISQELSKERNELPH